MNGQWLKLKSVTAEFHPITLLNTFSSIRFAFMPHTQYYVQIFYVSCVHSLFLYANKMTVYGLI
jgi:hypothetical protein